MTTAFVGHVVWHPDGPSDVELSIDPVLSARHHVSCHQAEDIDVVVLGRVARDTASPGYANDAEFVASCFCEHGGAFADMLFGEFAVAIFDRATNELHLARDVAGTRPLYYSAQPGTVWFASSIEAVCNGAGLTGDVNEDALAHYLCLRPAARGDTLMRDAHSAPAAHLLTFRPPTTESAGSVPQRSAVDYWRPEERVVKSKLNRQQAVAELVELLSIVVNESLRPGDVVGAHVTGGVDSAAVAAVLATTESARLVSPVAFAWQQDPDISAEPLADQELVKAIAASLGFPVRYCPMTLDSLKVSLARDVVRQPPEMLLLEDPVLAEAAEAGVTVLFSGWGGDECLSYRGNNHFVSLLRSGKLVQLVAQTRRVEGSTFRRLAATARTTAQRGPQSDRSPLRGYAASVLYRRVSRGHPDIYAMTGSRNAQIALLTYGHLAARTEAWSVAAASAGMQHMYPLLDRRIVEFALSLPSEFFAVPRPRFLIHELIKNVAPSDFPLPVKDEPSRAPASLETVRSLLAEYGPELPLRRESLDWLDLERLNQLVSQLPRDLLPNSEPGRLIAALEVAFQAPGAPLCELLQRSSSL